MKSEWYKDWFNTDEYLVVYKHRDKSEAEIFKKYEKDAADST